MAEIWYNDALRLRDFADALESAEYADSDDVLKKPYRFDDEYEVWKNNNSPSPEDGEWDNFIAGLNDYANSNG